MRPAVHRQRVLVIGCCSTNTAVVCVCRCVCVCVYVCACVCARKVDVVKVVREGGLEAALCLGLLKN